MPPSPPPLPPWPATLPARGQVRLRAVSESDVVMAQELSSDPYVPQTGSLPGDASAEEALAWVRRQQGRHAEGAGFSFTIEEVATEGAVGHCGLWLRELDRGRASAGYAIVPAARGRGLATDALEALTAFAWGVPELSRVVLLVEPWNTGSVRVAQRAGYLRESALRRHDVGPGGIRNVLRFVALRPHRVGMAAWNPETTRAAPPEE